MMAVASRHATLRANQAGAFNSKWGRHDVQRMIRHNTRQELRQRQRTENLSIIAHTMAQLVAVL